MKCIACIGGDILLVEGDIFFWPFFVCRAYTKHLDEIVCQPWRVNAGRFLPEFTQQG